MIKISHRGNLTGPNTAFYGENTRNAFEFALSSDNIHVMIDIQYKNKQFYLNDDIIDIYDFIDSFYKRDLLKKVWFRCYSIILYNKLENILFNKTNTVRNSRVNLFLVNNKGISATAFDTYHIIEPDKHFSGHGIIMHPEKWKNLTMNKNTMGFCSDYIFNSEEAWKQKN